MNLLYFSLKKHCCILLGSKSGIIRFLKLSILIDNAITNLSSPTSSLLNWKDAELFARRFDQWVYRKIYCQSRSQFVT